ncbi:MAG: hypothetical protein COC19_07535 [SAR86 cluster bacterium]|uniref:SPOR domain-containing protein n=1 Tax=SAR86 cluster bacterium TaxID=2030880 RepID=A0A2A4MHP3_9GAMM|nr:MAG: hypothetical protein COC19_07535 [SAR86 cluster bacterium]
MTQDFAKIKPEPLLDTKPAETPPAWTFMFTGLILGLVIGVFAFFLFYISGNLPPLQTSPAMVESTPKPAIDSEANNASLAEAAEPSLQLEFYDELKNSEVVVDATPVTLAAPTSIISNTTSENETGATYMLQSGAFRLLLSAQTQQQNLQNIGLAAVIKQEGLPGRILYLVQSGPYTSASQLSQAEQLLRANDIGSMRISLN